MNSLRWWKRQLGTTPSSSYSSKWPQLRIASSTALRSPPYVEPIPGPTTERFGELAARYGCYIVVGMPEVDPETDIYYNSLALVGPEGVVGKYRKTHSFISENTWAKDGDLDFTRISNGDRKS